MQVAQGLPRLDCGTQEEEDPNTRRTHLMKKIVMRQVTRSFFPLWLRCQFFFPENMSWDIKLDELLEISGSMRER